MHVGMADPIFPSDFLYYRCNKEFFAHKRRGIILATSLQSGEQMSSSLNLMQRVILRLSSLKFENLCYQKEFTLLSVSRKSDILRLSIRRSARSVNQSFYIYIYNYFPQFVGCLEIRHSTNSAFSINSLYVRAQ